MGSCTRIRVATVADAAAIQAIYAPYVETTAITGELVAPSVQEIEQRIAATLERFPYLVAERDGMVVGYCYVGPFRARPAYRHCVETSIYMKLDCKGGGMGRRLYDAMAKLLLLQNVYVMNACIACANDADPHVLPASQLFHERVGFSEVGRFTSVMRKFGRWYDTIWMERFIAQPPEEAGDFIPFPRLDQKAVQEILAQA